MYVVEIRARYRKNTLSSRNIDDINVESNILCGLFLTIAERNLSGLG